MATSIQNCPICGSAVSHTRFIYNGERYCNLMCFLKGRANEKKKNGGVPRFGTLQKPQSRTASVDGVNNKPNINDVLKKRAEKQAETKQENTVVEKKVEEVKEIPSEAKDVEPKKSTSTTKTSSTTKKTTTAKSTTSKTSTTKNSTKKTTTDKE